MDRKDIWPVLAFMLTGPITAVMYVFFAFGYWVYNKLGRDTFAGLLWRVGYGWPFSIANFAYNSIVGTFIWLERPYELQFTERLKRKKKEGYALAKFMCECVNFWDEKHC